MQRFLYYKGIVVEDAKFSFSIKINYGSGIYEF